jgi:trehalose/maltose transport system permease protein
VRYFPARPTVNAYGTVFQNETFRRALVNSAFISLTTVIISLAIGSLGAYALGRLKFRGRTIVLYTILSMTMFPAIAILGSLFTMVRALGIYNTPWALIMTYLTFTLPFTVWVLTNFFKSLPVELEQAAYVDGATTFQTFYMILLPLTAPGLVTTGLLAFINAWNEFLYALTFTISDSSRTAPVALALFSGQQQFEIPWADIMAAAVVVTVPLVVLVLFFQRRLVEGLTAGAVKG